MMLEINNLIHLMKKKWRVYLLLKTLNLGQDLVLLLEVGNGLVVLLQILLENLHLAIISDFMKSRPISPQPTRAPSWLDLRIGNRLLQHIHVCFWNLKIEHQRHAKNRHPRSNKQYLY